MPPFTNEFREKIKEEYLVGRKHMHVIASELGISYKGVQSTLARLKVKTRERSEALRRLSLNEDAFDELTPEALYWMGFLAADGNVSFQAKTSVKISLSIGAVDLEHMEKFKRFMGSGHVITPYDHVQTSGSISKMTRFRFNSAKVGNILISHGITDNKSKTIKVSDTLANSVDFWRGVVDGDGSLQDHFSRRFSPVISLVSGSLEFMQQYVSFVKGICATEKSAHKSKNSNTYQLGFTGTYAYRIIRHLYEDSVQHLDRKKATADKILATWKLIEENGREKLILR